MMTSEELEFDIREVMDEKLGLGRRMAACQRIADHDQAQRAVIANLERDVLIARNLASMATYLLDERNKQIEQQAKELGRLKSEIYLTLELYYQLEQENKTLREALQLLYDVQNGCPLPKYQADWDRAMSLTQHALKESPSRQ